MGNDYNIFGKFDWLLGEVGLNEKEQSDLKAFRGKTAAGDFCRGKVFEDGGRRFTFPEYFDSFAKGWDAKRGVTPRVRIVTIAEYLMGGGMEQLDMLDAPEEVFRVECELRRFHARKNGLYIRSACIDKQLIREYCNLFNVSGIREPLLVATGLIPPEVSSLDKELALKLASHELKPDFVGLYRYI